jgi:predicted transcriptional regulator
MTMIFDVSEIQKLRRTANLTQHELAKKAGVSQSLIAKIESGTLDPAFSKAQKIFAALTEASTKAKALDIMNKNLIVAHPGDSLKKTIATMKRYGISQMPVIEDKKAVGLVSEATILDALIRNKDIDTMLTKIMAEAPPIITSGASIDVVTQLLKEYPIILVSAKGRFLGHITKADVLMKAYR